MQGGLIRPWAENRRPQEHGDGGGAWPASRAVCRWTTFKPILRLAAGWGIALVVLLAAAPAAWCQEPSVEFQLGRDWRLLDQSRRALTVRGQIEPELPGQELEQVRPSPFETLFTGAAEEATDVMPISGVSGGETFHREEGQLNADPSIGGQIQKSTAAPSVGFQRRSPIAQDPRIRGYRWGQIYAQADGQYWLPARLDLDSMISRFDPSLIEEVTIINGPYGLRFGPAFSFINIRTADTPRYDGFTTHSRTGLSVLANGGQIYGRETVYGGSCNWGFIVNYGNRTGADYRPGGNADLNRIPASYQDQSFLGQLGYDLSENSRIEFRYTRLDQVDTEYAAQFFDINALMSDSFSATYTRTNPYNDSVFKAEAWYNRTRFSGDTNNPSKRAVYPGARYFPVIDRVESAIEDATGASNVRLDGLTDGNLTSAGARAVSAYGDAEWTQLRFGADVRYVEQHLHEQYIVSGTNVPTALEDFQTNMPFAQIVDPGIFAEFTTRWRPYLRSAIGGRIDWVTSDARVQGSGTDNFPDGLRPNTSLPGAPDSLPQNNVLLAAYLRNELELTSRWTVELSGGYAERAPTLMERYADGIFVGVIQNGFTRVIGDPNLSKERLWQIDAALKAEYDRWRGSAAFYYAWVLDYATYLGYPVIDPTGARLLQNTNTDLATLTGFELQGEWQVLPRVSLIGTLMYIEGTDQEINRPLPGIIPMEGRVVVRLRDRWDGSIWGVEFGVRMVDRQDRIGWLRQGQLGQEFSVEEVTPGFTISYLRGYVNVTENLHVYAGVENLFDRTYIEHLDLRLPQDTVGSRTFDATPVLSPGITPYVNVEWTY